MELRETHYEISRADLSQALKNMVGLYFLYRHTNGHSESLDAAAAKILEGLAGNIMLDAEEILLPWRKPWRDGWE